MYLFNVNFCVLGFCTLYHMQCSIQGFQMCNAASKQTFAQNVGEQNTQNPTVPSDEALNSKIESINRKNKEKWIKELNEKGYILCEKHTPAKIGFLSVRSIEAHQIKCNSQFQPECVSKQV